MTEHSSYVHTASSIVGIVTLLVISVSAWRYRRSGKKLEYRRYRMFAWFLLAVALTLLIAAPHVH